MHRLDKDTSGILIIAKNDGFMTYVQRQINNRTVKKTYIALVAGRIGETK
ncbi:RNA pseudouridine synthase [Candidatus Peregrinibacteria bacterium]|nr:RNA pseudouridine synthase [Candidatus Peregrinibacteria bacterium]MCB9804621.1 RNA pseudouridine synthase [Candidatus Peribacteria bacterium]